MLWEKHSKGVSLAVNSALAALADPGDSASHARGVANGDTDMGERCTGAIMSPGGLSEFSRMLSVFINCSKLKVCYL